MTWAHRVETEELGLKQKKKEAWRMEKGRRIEERVWESVWDEEWIAGWLPLKVEWSRVEGRRSEKGLLGLALGKVSGKVKMKGMKECL